MSAALSPPSSAVAAAPATGADAPRRRVLFVDDEQRVLDGLTVSLRRQRKTWDMHFACGGQAALELLATERFDVVVSDMRMPNVDGEALLRHVQREHPGTVRIVLSGQTEPSVAQRMIYVAHRFLAKPCNGDDLRRCVEGACELRSLLGDERLRELAGGVGQLSPRPTLYAELTRRLGSAEVDLDGIADLVEQDAATSAKVLQVVNSAFFGQPQSVTSPRRAVRLLGTETLRALVLAAGPEATPPDSPEFTGDAPAASPLHSIGMLVLAQRAPVEYAEVLREAGESGRPLHEVERERFGATHAAVGAYLLGLWGIPLVVVDAVARQHDAPPREPS